MDYMFNAYQDFGCIVNLADAVVKERQIKSNSSHRVFVKLTPGRRGYRVLYDCFKYFALQRI